jgi:hypothetical protein
MTRNAAHLLVDLINSYEVPPSTQPQSTRGFNSGSTPEWRNHIEVLNLVRQLDALIEGMERDGRNVAVFKDFVPAWYGGVYVMNPNWNGGGSNKPRPTCSKQAVAMLGAFALLLDANPYLEIGEEERRSLRDVLGEAEELLASEREAIPSDIRAYLQSLLARASYALDGLDTYGAENLRSFVMELSGAMNLQAQASEGRGDQPTAKRWRDAAWMLAAGFFTGSSTEAGKLAGQAGMKVLGVGDD